MTAVHQRLAVGILVLGALGTMWAAAGWWRGAPHAALRVYARLVLVAIAVQGALGVALAVRGDRPAENLHFLYGPAVLVAMLCGILLSLGEQPRREAAVLGFGFCGVLLLGVRAVVTGG